MFFDSTRKDFKLNLVLVVILVLKSKAPCKRTLNIVFFLFLLATAGVNHHVCLWNPYVISKPVGVSSNFQVICVRSDIFIHHFQSAKIFGLNLDLAH